MEIIKYEGFNDILFGFAQEQERNFLIYGKTSTPMISMNQEYTTIKYGFLETSMEIPTDKQTIFSMDLIPPIKFIQIKDEKEYDRLISILKELL